MAKDPVRVAVTGPAGNIGYSLVFRIAAGAMLGPDQPVILQLLETGRTAFVRCFRKAIALPNR